MQKTRVKNGSNAFGSAAGRLELQSTKMEKSRSGTGLWEEVQREHVKLDFQWICSMGSRICESRRQLGILESYPSTLGCYLNI